MKHERAKPWIDSSRLYMERATPASSNSNTWRSMASPPSSGSKRMISLPAPGTMMSVARYWSPKAWRPMTMGLVQPGTRRGTFLQMIGWRKMVPPMMLRMVPLGERHISLRPNSSTRPSSGVMVAHLTPTPCSLIASAESMVIWSPVWSRFRIDRS